MEPNLFNLLWADILVIIFFGFLFIAYVCIQIQVFNDEIERISLYHTPQSKNNITGEPYLKKCRKVIDSYLRLSIFVFIPIYATLIFDGVSNPSTAMIIAQIGTIGILIMMRILLNPTWDHPFVKPKCDERIIDSIKVFKERVFSLFFAFISITWIIVILLFFSTIGLNFQAVLNRVTPPDLNGIILVILLFSYIVSLTILTLIVEWILSKWKPILQTPITTSNKL
jgi:hypothetical protein